MDYVIRIPANKRLQLVIEEILFGPPGSLGLKPLAHCKSFHYQAESSTKPRRKSPRSSIITVSFLPDLACL